MPQKLLVMLLLLLFCRRLPAQVGGISFDARTDDPAFRICDSLQIYEYYNMSSYYRRHKREVAQFLMGHYKPDTLSEQKGAVTGYCTIRFIINCSGETGRFRIYEMDSAWHSCRFRDDIRDRLLQVVRSFGRWQPASYEGKVYDTYQYITFKLKKAAIGCILP